MNDVGIDLPFPTHVEIQNAHDLKEAREDLERHFNTDKKVKSKKATGTRKN